MKPWKSTVHKLTSVVKYFDMYEWDDLGSESYDIRFIVNKIERSKTCLKN